MKQRKALPRRLLNEAIEAVELIARRDAIENRYGISQNCALSAKPTDSVEGMLVMAYGRAWHSQQGINAFNAGATPESCPHASGQRRTDWLAGYLSHAMPGRKAE
jgi:ribosome modulation factor